MAGFQGHVVGCRHFEHSVVELRITEIVLRLISLFVQTKERFEVTLDSLTEDSMA